MSVMIASDLIVRPNTGYRQHRIYGLFSTQVTLVEIQTPAPLQNKNLRPSIAEWRMDAGPKFYLGATNRPLVCGVRGRSRTPPSRTPSSGSARVFPIIQSWLSSFHRWPRILSRCIRAVILGLCAIARTRGRSLSRGRPSGGLWCPTSGIRAASRRLDVWGKVAVIEILQASPFN